VIVKRRDGAVLRQLRTLYNVGTIGDLADGQLLERFATDADEVAELAFSALVERHESLVWRVCLAILRDQHAAEDAFQATFLVLVRKARGLWVRDSLGPWLHQVAYRTASSLKKSIIRRRRREQSRAQSDVRRAVSVMTLPDSDRDAAIHDELNRLPEKYQAPVVLCDLEGRTQQEAARFLGWPIGTVKSRQAVGRRLIRERLARRGISLVITGAIVDFLRQPTSAAVPGAVSQGAVNAAMRSARLVAGYGISAPLLTITQGVLRAMFWTKIRFLTSATLVIVITAGSGVFYVRGSQESSAKDGQSVSKQPPTTPSLTPKSGSSPNAPKQTELGPPDANLRAQRLATRRAKARYEIAKLTRELAELALEEYGVVGYQRDLAGVQGEIKLAESELARAKDRLDWAKRMHEKGFVSESQKVSEELNNQRAVFALEQAQAKLAVLKEYTKAKTLKELKSEVEKARINELEKEALWDMQKAKEAGLQRQIVHED
jgi:RNA polymerase sigma factor (sigma-70 family)